MDDEEFGLSEFDSSTAPVAATASLTVPVVPSVSTTVSETKTKKEASVSKVETPSIVSSAPPKEEAASEKVPVALSSQSPPTSTEVEPTPTTSAPAATATASSNIAAVVPDAGSLLEKKSARAARFGVPIKVTSEEQKTATDTKKKARADRFGIEVKADKAAAKSATAAVDAVDPEVKKVIFVRLSMIPES